MNRDIKCRGMKEDGTWVYGYYIRHETRQVCMGDDKLGYDEIDHFIAQDGFADWNMPRDISLIKVIPESVGQYVESVNAYEGDVLLCSREDEDGLISEWEGVIRYNKEKGRLMVQDIGIYQEVDIFFENRWYEINDVEFPEIITNVHEGRVRKG